jgi:hypothetical protein
MTAARGDSKPCTHDGCAGKMHFKRDAENELRWVCDKDAHHEANIGPLIFFSERQRG